MPGVGSSPSGSEQGVRCRGLRVASPTCLWCGFLSCSRALPGLILAAVRKSGGRRPGGAVDWHLGLPRSASCSFAQFTWVKKPKSQDGPTSCFFCLLGPLLTRGFQTTRRAPASTRPPAHL